MEKRAGWRNVVALGFVSFFTDISTELILGALPVFVVQELGATRAELGLIDGIADALNYAMRMLSGLISDKLGVRKRIILAGYAISNLAKPLFAAAHTWVDVLLVRVVDRVGKGVRTPARDALIAASAPSRSTGKAFGLHRTLDQLGAIVGPLLATALIPVVGFRGVFALSLLPGLAALAVLALGVREVGVRRVPSGHVLASIRGALTPKLKAFLASVAVFAMGAYSFSFLLVYSGSQGMPSAYVPLVYAAINIMHTLAGLPSGELGDRIGPVGALAIGCALLPLASAIAALGGGVTAAVVAALVYGVHAGFYETNLRASVAACSKPQLRGTAYGLLYMVLGAAGLVSNIVFGALWDAYGAKAAFAYSILLTTAGAGLLAILPRMAPEEEV